MLEKVNKLSLPATILIGCIILGGFYYASQVSKQKSIERQQWVELQDKANAEQAMRDKEASDRLSKMSCADEAAEAATEQYKETCTYNCKEGYYYTANYDNYYASCLRRKGLE